MSIYSNKLAHVQIVINCRYSVAQMCTREYARPLFRQAVYRWRHETQYAHNKILDGPEKKKIKNRLSRLEKCNRLGAMNKMSYHEMSLEFVRIVGPKGLLEETRLVTRKKN